MSNVSLLEEYIAKSGYGYTNLFSSPKIAVAEVFALLKLIEDKKVPDGSFSDDACSIWSAALRACKKNPEGEYH